MDKLPKVGQTAHFYVCGCHYDHVVVEVISAKKVVIAQGTFNSVIGPRETFTKRKNGRWVKVGSTERNGYAFIDV